jgi:tripartite-type tricarboxylate transporter receptor subunit TctC
LNLLDLPKKIKFGYYSVGGLDFISKIAAIEHDHRTQHGVKWHFVNEILESYDWTLEPTESLQELYRQRAQQIKEHYDYVVVWYSGGAEALGRAIKKQVVPVPYKGGAPALIDLMGNQHPLGCHLYSLVRSHIQDGRLIPLMVTSTKRSAQFPDVPTASEVGLRELEGIQIWNGLIANTTADPAVLKQVEDVMDRLVKDPVRSRNFSQTVDLELDPALTLGRGPAFKKFVLQDIERYKTAK